MPDIFYFVIKEVLFTAFSPFCSVVSELRIDHIGDEKRVGSQRGFGLCR